MNPLGTPHHLKAYEWHRYREGVIMKRPGNGLARQERINHGLISACSKIASSTCLSRMEQE